MSEREWPPRLGLEYDDDVEAFAGAPDPTGETAGLAAFGRCSGRTSVECDSVGRPRERETLFSVGGEVARLAIAPGGRHALAVVRGERAVHFALAPSPDPMGVPPAAPRMRRRGAGRERR